jgi:Fe-S cluster biogenesis protein NfuA/nitrite reductase/ring-hydroxylating ferredoxin subunit
VEFDHAVAELQTLVETLERESDERALMLLELVDAIHRPALELILAGELDHPIAAAVLAMYGLAELDEREQVEAALDDIRPYIESHGGSLELLSVHAGVVHVRMSGSCRGCAASAITLRRGIERRLRERYPNFAEIVAHEDDEPAGAGNGAGARSSGAVHARAPRFRDAVALAALAGGKPAVVEVDGEAVLVLAIDGEPYAFRDRCPVETDRRLSLAGGRLAGSVLVCPWHNCAYDARTGMRVDDQPQAAPLEAVPVALRDGVVQVAVNVA